MSYCKAFVSLDRQAAIVADYCRDRVSSTQYWSPNKPMSTVNTKCRVRVVVIGAHQTWYAETEKHTKNGLLENGKMCL